MKDKATDDLTLFAGEVRDVYRRYVGELEQRHRAGESGLEIAKKHSAAVELVTVHLFDSLGMHKVGKLQRMPALVAIGGFGRGELSPKSDVDLLFLWGRKSGQEANAFAGYLVRLMWDAGLKLGHSVRTVAELRRALKRDTDLKTALLDGRWICGDEALKVELVGIKSRIREEDSGKLLVEKIEETRRRWKKYGWSYHLVEPNVKESPGGLRDFQTIRWVGMVLPWEGTLRGLYRLAIIDRDEIGSIKRAFDFLVRARNELNFLTGSSSNVLTVEMQRRVASGLGYKDKGDLLAVERFMRDYYSNTMSIYRVLERILEETRGKGSLRIIDGVLYKRVGTKELGQLELRLTSKRMKADPLFAFKEQLRSGRRFSPHMESRIRSAFKRKPGKAVITGMKKSFIELLRMRGRKAQVIRSMHELGVLKLLFPPFEKLRCLKRYDLYHQYTADEHSFQAISHLEDLGEGEGGLLPRIYSEVAETVELYLATLLHDIGKVGAVGHARSGAVMADRILESFPISARSRSLITFLIKNHLLLSHFSQRRDMEDRDTRMQLVKKVRNHRNLKLLHLLTYADLKATGSGIWNGWKENLLDNLYYKASELLADKSEPKATYSEVFSKKRKKMLGLCKTRAEKSRMSKHLDGLPDRYTMVVSPPRVKAHLDMIARLGRRQAVTELRRLRHSIELVICTRDRPFRLSQLCGVITINDLNILGAYAFTRSDGTVIDLFHIEGIDGRLSLSKGAREKFNDDLQGVLAGRIDLDAAFIAHVSRWKRRAAAGIPVPCSVEFENDITGECTIVDISAGDRPGLLYRITHVFSEEGLDIQSAQITTRGGVAADSFYVRDTDGGKLSGIARMRSIRERLISELESDPGAGGKSGN